MSTADKPNLLAGFNSGFRMADSRGGYAAGGHVAKELRQGAASMVIDAQGKMDVVAWNTATPQAPVAVRQNLDLIVDGGQLVPGLDDNSGNRWGLTVGNKLFVWRSGVGIDAQGRILYVASEGLSVAHSLRSCSAQVLSEEWNSTSTIPG